MIIFISVRTTLSLKFVEMEDVRAHLHEAWDEEDYVQEREKKVIHIANVSGLDTISAIVVSIPICIVEPIWTIEPNNQDDDEWHDGDEKHDGKAGFVVIHVVELEYSDGMLQAEHHGEEADIENQELEECDRLLGSEHVIILSHEHEEMLHEGKSKGRSFAQSFMLCCIFGFIFTSFNSFIPGQLEVICNGIDYSEAKDRQAK